MSLGLNAHINPNVSDSAEPQIPEKPQQTASDTTGNPYLENPEAGLQLCAQLVAAGQHRSAAEEKLAELKRLVEDEFLPLTETDYNTTGAAAYRNLKQICCDLDALIQFPGIERHYTVAVGGMFSAGKSRFLNALLGRELLPTDTAPTTSIPTYLTHGKKDSIQVLNKFGGRIAIDDMALQAICHSFHERYSVSFAHILRLVHVQREQLKFPQITFLDTPGYSKSDALDSADNVDAAIARDHLRQADFLIWLIDMQNGTVPQEDLQFIRSLEFNRPILFVMNKADKKTATEIEQTLVAAKRDLARADDIQVFGVTAYSAEKVREYGDQPCLEKFLHAVSAAKAGTPLYQQAETVFSTYRAFYESEKLRLRNQRGVLNEAVFSTGLEIKLQEKAKALAAGAKARIDKLTLAQSDMMALQRQALRLIKEIAAASGLTLADAPPPALRRLTNLLDGCEFEQFRFQGSMNKLSEQSLKSLLSKPNLESLRARVRKVGSVCFYFDVEGEFEVMVLIGEVQKITGFDRNAARALLPVGTEVSLQLQENERCSIIYPPLTVTVEV